MFCELEMREGEGSAFGGERNAFNRRSFLKCALASGAALGLSEFAEPAGAISSGSGQDDLQFVVEAKFYQKQQNRKIKCKLCPRECVVGDKERGYCGVRENRRGTYYSLVHSRVCAAHVDPVEKKPLFHYLPGTVAFSIATAGCNVNCNSARTGIFRSRGRSRFPHSTCRPSGWPRWRSNMTARRLPIPIVSR